MWPYSLPVLTHFFSSVSSCDAIPCSSKATISVPIPASNSTDFPLAETDWSDSSPLHKDSTVTPQESRIVNKRKRMETSKVESLMQEQVESVNRQVDVLEEIRDLIKQRNETEERKVFIMEQLLQFKKSKLESASEHMIDESDCVVQVNTIDLV